VGQGQVQRRIPVIIISSEYTTRYCLEAYQRLIADKLAREPEEGLLEVIVGLGGDIVVLQILLAVEGDGLGLDFALLHIDLVAGEHDGDVLADADEIAVPVGDVLVGDAGGDVEHDDAALAVDVVSIAQTTELLLPCSIPHVELDLAEVLCEMSVLLKWWNRSESYRRECEGVDFDTERGDVLLLEFTRQMALDECCLL
jgi:hypothetical protein